MIIPQFEGRTLTKAHGTGNDFILVPDFPGFLDLDSASIAAVCDRHRGIGADGFIRVVRTQAVAPEILKSRPDAEWFMDYRNADGSLAQMCGNGVRVFAHYLRVQGLVDMELGASIAVATRGGVKDVVFDGENYTVDMGEYVFARESFLDDAGTDTSVEVAGIGALRGISVTMPNPHTVVFLADEDELAAARLTEAPRYDLEPAEGTNLELVVARDEGTLPMRVLERGVGETLACGTGTCAAAAAVLRARGEGEGTVTLRSPGGELTVRIVGGRAYLTGPAILVAEFGLIGIAGY